MKTARSQRRRDARSAGNGGAGTAARRPANGQGNGRNGARAVDLSPLNGSIGYTVRRAQMALFADFVTSLREVNLRPGQFGVLMVVHGNPGLSQSEVCAALGFQKANLVPLISGLESRGLIVRKPALQDRRSYALHLTARGRALLRRALGAAGFPGGSTDAAARREWARNAADFAGSSPCWHSGRHRRRRITPLN